MAYIPRWRGEAKVVAAGKVSLWRGEGRWAGSHIESLSLRVEVTVVGGKKRRGDERRQGLEP